MTLCLSQLRDADTAAAGVRHQAEEWEGQGVILKAWPMFASRPPASPTPTIATRRPTAWTDCMVQTRRATARKGCA